MITIILTALGGALVGAFIVLRVLPRGFKRYLMSDQGWLAAAALKLQSEKGVAAFVRHIATHYDGTQATVVLEVADAIEKRTSRLVEEIRDDNGQET